MQLARLAGLEGLTRSIMVGTVPLAALDALGSKQAVSYAFLAGSTMTLAFTLNVGRLERAIGRRTLMSSAIVSLFCAAALFAFGPAWTFPVAIGLRETHASVFSVCFSLYVMDLIGKTALTAAESRRAVHLAVAWVCGPTLGTWMFGNVHPTAPFLAAMTLAVCLLVYLGRIRLEDQVPAVTHTSPPPSPIASIRRFVGQRNLRIAYVITLVRSTFWATLFIYGPLYVVEAGYSSAVAGIFLSVSSATLFVGPFVQRRAASIGVRACIMTGFALMTTGLVGLAVIGDAQPVGIAFWLIGAVGGGIVDVLGNIPFMRLVKPRERGAMTSVFTTWREVSFLLAPAIAATVLAFGQFWVLYLVLACLTGAALVVATYLPRRL